jgi:hypothetical protein
LGRRRKELQARASFLHAEINEEHTKIAELSLRPQLGTPILTQKTWGKNYTSDHETSSSKEKGIRQDIRHECSNSVGHEEEQDCSRQRSGKNFQ